MNERTKGLLTFSTYVAVVAGACCGFVWLALRPMKHEVPKYVPVLPVAVTNIGGWKSVGELPMPILERTNSNSLAEQVKEKFDAHFEDGVLTALMAHRYGWTDDGYEDGYEDLLAKCRVMRREIIDSGSESSDELRKIIRNIVRHGQLTNVAGHNPWPTKQITNAQGLTITNVPDVTPDQLKAVCALKGHSWRDGRPGEGIEEGRFFADYNPGMSFRTCRICGEAQSKEEGEWK